jgi:FixJ family two-component response regulator
LTAHERKVAAHLMQGLRSKQIGKTLSISHRTVEIHRTRLMRKYKAANAGDLVQKPMAGQSPFPHGECGLVKSNV